jgi:hypothetical protein
MSANAVRSQHHAAATYIKQDRHCVEQLVILELAQQEKKSQIIIIINICCPYGPTLTTTIVSDGQSHKRANVLTCKMGCIII